VAAGRPQQNPPVTKSLIASQTSGLHQRFRFTALWEGQRVEVSEAAYYFLIAGPLLQPPPIM
ncbi:hypothetical protein, partial [Brucella rhizosphaerae]|uniref:hypothetical protein n=1 Tax=Brucella rhizosphaerae TaxID=571254 RepID=UPI001AEBBE18